MDVPLLLIVLVFFSFQTFLLILVRAGLFKKYNFSTLLGIFIGWRTKRGRKFIEWLARATRFWRFYGNFAIGIVFVCALLMAFTLTWTSFLITFIPAGTKPAPEMLLGLPGINPIIPLWYGIFALAIAMVLHEFAHGILTRVARVKLKSLGLLFFIFPMGAFAEPDEDELLKIAKRKRARVFAVGPATNIIVALVCALLFSWSMMGSLKPREDGVIVMGFSKESPLYTYGSELGMVITDINGTKITTSGQFDSFSAPPPAHNISVWIFYKGEKKLVNVTSGIVIYAVYANTPAAKVKLKEGMIISTVNNTVIRNNNDFTSTMGRTHSGEKVNITVYPKSNGTYGKAMVFSVTLADKSDFSGISKDKGVGFLGVSAMYLGIRVDNVGHLARELAHPLAGSKSFDDYLNGIKFYIALPIYRMSPFQSPFTDVYQPTGFWTGIPADSFWVIANCLYWLFWLNLMLGLTNALPALPFDGGYVFKDFVDMCVVRSRPGMKKEKREKYVNVIVYAVSFILIGMIFWMVIATLI